MKKKEGKPKQRNKREKEKKITTAPCKTNGNQYLDMFCSKVKSMMAQRLKEENETKTQETCVCM